MSRIASVKTILTTLGGFSSYSNYVLVKITTEDGAYGWGDASLAGRETASAAVVENHFTPLLIGREAHEIEDIWQMLYRGGYWRGGPVLMSALAGVDMALWDIKGKMAGLPVYQLLGGRCRDGAMAYAHAGGPTLADLTDSVRAKIDQGFKVVRCQGAGYGNAPGQDKEPREGAWAPHPEIVPFDTFEPGPYLRGTIAMFDHLRSEVGFDVDLCHDSHERLRPVEAAKLAHALEPHGLFFLEDLLKPEHPQSFRVIRAASTTPLAMGELYHSTEDCLPVISEQLIDFIRCDLAHAGGITEARRIAVIADAFAVRTAWHGPTDISPITHAANVHVDLSIPNFGVQEYSEHPPLVHEVISGEPLLRDGYLDVLDTPGLGVDVDEAAAEAHPYEVPFAPMGRLRDGTMHDW